MLALFVPPRSNEVANERDIKRLESLSASYRIATTRVQWNVEFQVQRAMMSEDGDKMRTGDQPATLALEAALSLWNQPPVERKRRRCESSIVFGDNDEANALETDDFPCIEWSFSSDDSVSSSVPTIDLKSVLFQSHRHVHKKRRLVRCRSIFKDLSDTQRPMPSTSLALETSLLQSRHYFPESDPEFSRKMDELKVSNRSLDEILSNICIDSV